MSGAKGGLMTAATAVVKFFAPRPKKRTNLRMRRLIDDIDEQERSNAALDQDAEDTVKGIVQRSAVLGEGSLGRIGIKKE